MVEQIDYTVQYDNSARVENSDLLVNQYILDAALFREQENLDAEFDLSYGPEPRNQLDIFWPKSGRDCPITMFIHGGYWQRLDRTAFSHIVDGLLQNGIAVVVPSYTLCPDISVGGIINEMRRACLMLYQTHKKPITVFGHSAGGHLAACLMATDWTNIHPDLPSDLVTSGMGISGVYDLIPLVTTPQNVALRLDEQTARAVSPIHWMPDALHQFDVWVGGDESEEFIRQTEDLADSWEILGTKTKSVLVEGANHFSIIDQLVDPKSDMVKRLLELIEHPIDDSTLPQIDEEKVLEEMASAQDEVSKNQPEQQTESHQAEAEVAEQVEGNRDVDGGEVITS